MQRDERLERVEIAEQALGRRSEHPAGEDDVGGGEQAAALATIEGGELLGAAQRQLVIGFLVEEAVGAAEHVGRVARRDDGEDGRRVRRPGGEEEQTDQRASQRTGKACRARGGG